jgi:L-threonylcarbamoyladenylate synthase
LLSQAQIEHIDMLSPFHLRESVRHLLQGDVIAYPTEAVFGLGCDPLNAEAVYRLLAMKQRPVDKGLILVAADLNQLLPYLQPLSDKEIDTLQKSWPGPVTWIVPCLRSVPVWLRGHHQSLAVRVSAHPVIQQLCSAWGGPIVSTSANISGRPPARTPLEVRRSFQGQVDCILHAETGGAVRPTQIRVLGSDTILRD